MYDISRKKQRWHKREFRRIIQNLKNVSVSYQPENLFEYEEVKTYANLFYSPRGKERKELMSVLLEKTEEIIRNKPIGIPFCKVILCVYENNIAHSSILLLFSEKEYQSFWHRTQIEVQKWTRIYEDSFVENLGLETVLKEYCYLEEVQNEEENFKQRIWFYGEI